MSDIPLRKAALEKLLEAEAKYVPSYRMASNPMPAMPQCTLYQYFSKYIPEFLKIQIPNTTGKEINRLPVVCQKFIRDIIYTIYMRMSQNVSYGSLNPKHIWIVDGRACIPPASQSTPHYSQGFPMLMNWMFSHLMHRNHVELDHFLDQVKLLNNEITFLYLYLHPLLQTKEERYAYPTSALLLMQSIQDWRYLYKGFLRTSSGKVDNFVFDRNIVGGNPIFHGVMAEWERNSTQSTDYPTTVVGELELVRNSYAHWQQHKTTLALVQTEEAELIVAYYFPKLLLHIYKFFSSMQLQRQTDFFGVFMKDAVVGDIRACSSIED